MAICTPEPENPLAPPSMELDALAVSIRRERPGGLLVTVHSTFHTGRPEQLEYDVIKR